MEHDNHRYQEYLKSDKWKAIAQERLKIDRFMCQGCGCCGTPTNPLEIHHLSYAHLYNEENRIYEDLVTLCRACHKQTHKIMERTTSASGRKGWKDNPRIPQVHVFTVSGTDRQFKEETHV